MRRINLRDPKFKPNKLRLDLQLSRCNPVTGYLSRPVRSCVGIATNNHTQNHFTLLELQDNIRDTMEHLELTVQTYNDGFFNVQHKIEGLEGWVEALRE